MRSALIPWCVFTYLSEQVTFELSPELCKKSSHAETWGKNLECLSTGKPKSIHHID